MTLMSKKLHLGCGSKTPEDWINLDGSWNAWLRKFPHICKLLKIFRLVPSEIINCYWNPNIYIHDVRKPLPFPDNSFSAIYASHLMEHLYLEEGKKLLEECYRVLEPNGILRMVVPDLTNIVREYIEDNSILHNQLKPINKADRLNKRLGFRTHQPPSGNIFYKLYIAFTDFHLHKWLYDAESLISYFNMVGFTEVEDMQLYKSRIERIENIEDPGRILNGSGICIEGVKPSAA